MILHGDHGGFLLEEYQEIKVLGQVRHILASLKIVRAFYEKGKV